MEKVKAIPRHIAEFLLRHLRWSIVLIGLILFGTLWWQAHLHDPSTVNGGLLVNLAATALTVAFSALLIDWLYERRQRLLLAFPLKAAKHELGSICFIVGLTLGRSYLNSFASIMSEFTQGKPPEMKSPTRLNKNLMSELQELTPQACPNTSLASARSLIPQIVEGVTGIEEILRLYGFALDTELRDNTYTLRYSLRDLRDILQSFELNSEIEHIATMQEVVALRVKNVAQAVNKMNVEIG